MTTEMLTPIDPLEAAIAAVENIEEPLAVARGHAAGRRRR